MLLSSKLFVLLLFFYKIPQSLFYHSTFFSFCFPLSSSLLHAKNFQLKKQSILDSACALCLCQFLFYSELSHFFSPPLPFTNINNYHEATKTATCVKAKSASTFFWKVRRFGTYSAKHLRVLKNTICKCLEAH